MLEGIRIRLENNFSRTGNKKTIFWEKLDLFFRKKSHSAEKPKRRPIKFAKRLFQIKNFLKVKAYCFTERELFRTKVAHSAEK